MAGNLHLHAGLASYQSFRPNVYESSSSSRVTPDAISPTEEKSGHRHKSHRHHHHRSSHDREHRHSSTRRHAREVVQSARQLQPPTSFGDLLKQARGSKDTSPSHSRKGSIAPRNGDGDDTPDVGISMAPRRPLRPEDVELERRRVEVRERDLRVVLQSLSDQSMKTSRRLDDTYYSILEKVSILRQTIGTLQELSSLTKELHENFESDTKDLVDDVRGQFDGFDNFDDQQTQIASLEERISSSKKKADSLTTRLAKAKERVEARSKAEAEWETANSRRLRYIWGTAGTIVALIIALVLFHHLKTPQPAMNPATKAQILGAPIPDIAKEVIIGPPPSLTKEEPKRSRSAFTGDDDRLRVFDEL